jgi:hypothetical protein
MMFKPDHIRVAWNRLQEEGWILNPDLATVAPDVLPLA